MCYVCDLGIFGRYLYCTVDQITVLYCNSSLWNQLLEHWRCWDRCIAEFTRTPNSYISSRCYKSVTVLKCVIEVCYSVCYVCDLGIFGRYLYCTVDQITVLYCNSSLWNQLLEHWRCWDRCIAEFTRTPNSYISSRCYKSVTVLKRHQSGNVKKYVYLKHRNKLPKEANTSEIRMRVWLQYKFTYTKTGSDYGFSDT